MANTGSVGKMLDEFEWPPLEAQWDRSSLHLFHKMHCGPVSIEKDKYMAPTHSFKTTRLPYSAKYFRYQTYSDALRNSFFPRNIPKWNSFLLRWSIPSPKRSLRHSSFSKKYSRKMFYNYNYYYYSKIPKLALPGIMTVFDRASKRRKKEIM